MSSQCGWQSVKLDIPRIFELKEIEDNTLSQLGKRIAQASKLNESQIIDLRQSEMRTTKFQNIAAIDIDENVDMINGDDSADLLCDELLHEIAIGSVEGLLEESEFEDITDEGPVTPEGGSYFVESQMESLFINSTEPGQMTTSWSTDSFIIPTLRSLSNDVGGEITTVMLRNIPNKYTRAGLLAALSDHGFDPATCNNLYLPMDAESGCNLGYAFLNFLTHGHALEFKAKFDGCRLPSSGSRKICSVVWANKQGLFQFSNSQLAVAPPPPPPMPLEVFDPYTQMRYHQLPPAVQSTKIFIGGLPVSSTDEDLLNYFSRFGPVKECTIIVDRASGLSRGFGFVDFVYPESVRIVEEAQQRRPHVISCRVVSVRFYGAYSG
jgi:hypothetical protein